MILASAEIDTTLPQLEDEESYVDEISKNSRVVIFAFRPGDKTGAIERKFEKVADWYYEGVAKTAGVHSEPDG